MKWIGIDLGGTWIKGALVNHKGHMFEYIKKPTPAMAGREATLNTLVEIIDYLIGKHPSSEIIGGIGIGSAGQIDRDRGKVIFATDNLPGWSGTDIRHELNRLFDQSIYVDNDVNMAALGEAWLGSMNKVTSFFFVALGTGIGGAFYHQGDVLSGHRGGAAEIGHIILYPDGIPCNCGQKGCLEQYASGTALNRRARELNPTWDSFRLISAYGESSPKALQGMKSYLKDLAIGLVSIQNAFDPEYVVIGGGISETYAMWERELDEIIKQITAKQIQILPALLHNQAGILGAAKLAMQHTRMGEVK